MRRRLSAGTVDVLAGLDELLAALPDRWDHWHVPDGLCPALAEADLWPVWELVAYSESCSRAEVVAAVERAVR